MAVISKLLTVLPRTTHPTYAKKTHHPAEICSCTQYTAKLQLAEAAANISQKEKNSAEELNCKMCLNSCLTLTVGCSNYQPQPTITSPRHRLCNTYISHHFTVCPWRCSGLRFVVYLLNVYLLRSDLPCAPPRTPPRAGGLAMGPLLVPKGVRVPVLVG
jgi:hypothetical protein